MKNIFQDIKVIDLTKVFSGPFATRMLADYGAQVIKIEDKKYFDDSRSYPPLKNGWSGYFEALNRNKKGISLNLKDPTDLEYLYRLVKKADVFVENLTPSVKRKLKVDYDTLKKINPKIIYASLSGVGQNSDRKYYDVIAQAESGLMSLCGYPKEPMKIGPAIIDAFSGMTLAFAISSALFYREKFGIGQYLDVAMLSCAMNLLENNIISYSITGKNPIRAGNMDNTISPFGVFKAKNGYLVVAVGNNNLWNILSKFLKKHVSFDSSLFATNSLRLENNEKLTEIIEKTFSFYVMKDLLKKLSSLKIPCSKVNEMSEVCTQKNNFKTGALVHFKHSKLGDCIIPGSCINFNKRKITIKESPDIGKDNTEYGL